MQTIQTKVERLYIDLEIFRSINNLELYSKKGDFDLHILYQPDIDSFLAIQKYEKISFGEKIKHSFTHKNIDVPIRIGSADIEVANKFYKKSNLGKYLASFAAKSNSNIISWGFVDDSTHRGTNFKAEFENVNPYALLGALTAAVKDNSAALGKDAVLFDTKPIEQVPEIAKYINQYLQRKI